MVTFARLLTAVRQSIRHRAAAWAREECGAILVLAALGTAGLVALVGLALDVGKVVQERRELQNAADAGALAGAAALLDGRSVSEATLIARDYATRNAAGSVVTVQIPPTAGSRAGDTECAYVEVRETVSDFFAPIGARDVGARAVACTVLVPTPYSVIALDESACRALNLDSNARIVTRQGGVFVNSECADSALYMSSNALMDSLGNDIVGGVTLRSNAVLTPAARRSHHIEDPLAGLTAPVPPTSPVQECPDPQSDEPVTLQPGYYNCTIESRSNAQITFAPGNYYITGGIDLDSNVTVTFGAGIYTLGGVGIRTSSNVTLTANGAMFYLEDGCVNINSNGWINITAPTSGPYAGISFFQSRSNTCTVRLRSNTGILGWGTVYAANAEVNFHSNATSNMQLIARRIHLDSNASINLAFNENFEALRPEIKLVE